MKASPRGSPHCMRRDDTIAAECFMKQKIEKCTSRFPPQPRGAIKISPPSYFLHSEIFSSSSSGPLPAGNSIAERHSSNVPRNQRAEREMYSFSASSSAHPATFHCRHRVSNSVAGACPWRDPATQGQCSDGMRRGHDSAGVVAIRSPLRRCPSSVSLAHGLI